MIEIIAIQGKESAWVIQCHGFSFRLEFMGLDGIRILSNKMPAPSAGTKLKLRSQ
jgi:hypothetical protein